MAKLRDPKLDDMRAALLLFVAVVLLGVLPARAADVRTEVFELNRPATPVAELVKPLLGANGVASAVGHTLIIRTDADTLSDIRAIIDKLDTPLRTLLVSVRHGRERAHQAAGVGVYSSRGGITQSQARSGGGFGGGVSTINRSRGRGQASARVYSSRSRASGNDFSSVQVLDGNEAFISTGKDVPVRTRSVVSDGDVRIASESVEYRKVATGFYVRPRLITNGTEVLMEVAPTRAALGKSATRLNRTPVIREQSVVTTVRGRLGEWIPLAANSRVGAASGNALVRSSERLRETNTQVFVKVEVVR